MGRPTSFNKQVADKILDGLASDRSLASICREKGMPGERTVYTWVRENEEFRQNYARAREDQGHTVADKLIQLREDVESGKLDPQAATFIMNSIKWESGKRAPKMFADKPVHIDASTTIKTDSADGFATLASALERAASTLASRADSTGRMVEQSEARPDNP
jgi:transposase-like protein